MKSRAKTTLRPSYPRPRLTIGKILKWAKAHYDRTGVWPSSGAGPVYGEPGEKWINIHFALRNGSRGLPRGSSLSAILRPYLKTDYRLRRPQLTVEKILAWCDAHRKRTGQWPTHESGRVIGADGETWDGIRMALKGGRRGVPPSGSLAVFLAKHRGTPYDRRNVRGRNLTLKQIAEWAIAHHQATGRWPTIHTGRVLGTSDETWSALAQAMHHGFRGLKRRQSFPKLLDKLAGKHRNLRAPRLTRRQILAWADAHYRRTGAWPNTKTGAVDGVPGETWEKMDVALKHGLRGLRRKPKIAHQPASARNRESLLKLLHRYRNAPRFVWLKSKLTEEKILEWADEHHARTGQWPKAGSGIVAAAPENRWVVIDNALKTGCRGLPGKSSLARLLARRRGMRHASNRPRLDEKLVLRWADAFHRRTRRWPNPHSGPIPEHPGETWSSVGAAMFTGTRGMPRKSLSALLKERRGVLPGSFKPELTVTIIREWAEAHYRRRGRWPSRAGGLVEDAPGESWANIDAALVNGHRGLQGQTSLSRVLKGRKTTLRRPIARARPALTMSQVLLWAKAHARRYGEWPHRFSGRVDDAPGENWLEIDKALAQGERGLTRCSSLASLLARRRLPARSRSRARPIH